MFSQYWYWYPLLNFLSLSLTPTALIGLNKDLKVPKSFTFISNAKPSMYKYPDFLKKEENKKGEKVETAVLSTTVKVRARADRKNKPEGGAGGNEDTKDKEMTHEDEKKDEDKKEEEKKEEELPVEEPTF
jgi:26S proteasome regulatory subunit N2